MKNAMVFFSLLILLFSASAATARSPLDAVQSHVNDVLAVLRTPTPEKYAAENQKKAKLRSIADSMFDFVTLSKWSLGKNWRKFSEEQKKEFVNLYKKILEKAYMDKIMAYTDERVLFKKNIMFTNNRAEVHTVVQTSSAEIPINYRVILTDGNWQVYDVIIEGVSLVKNYRSQFNTILAKKSPEELLQILRDKAAES